MRTTIIGRKCYTVTVRILVEIAHSLALKKLQINQELIKNTSIK